MAILPCELSAHWLGSLAESSLNRFGSHHGATKLPMGDSLCRSWGYASNAFQNLLVGSILVFLLAC